MKTAQDFLAEANAVVKRITPEEGIAFHGKPNSVFVDVRDSGDIAKSGTVDGAVRIARGFIEFAADNNTPHHNPAMQKDANIFVLCALGGQAALAGKTLKDMGYTSVTNVGGFNDWKEAGGPTEA
ncbi:rhodanese-like domain-containing protein [Maritalea sp.]|jgi:rhodanese-related sulfurtransferase|uniref:rhodanese-like domain-containing protein n=1 Tax=Maritalea sp. TaxID=2003361 RepID=UPI0039E5A0AF